MVNAGVVEALVTKLRHAAADGRSAAAITLARMAANVEARERIAAADAVPAVVAGLRGLDAQGMEGCVICLEKLVTLQGAAEQTMREPVWFALSFASLLAAAREVCPAVYVFAVRMPALRTDTLDYGVLPRCLLIGCLHYNSRYLYRSHLSGAVQQRLIVCLVCLHAISATCAWPT